MGEEGGGAVQRDGLETARTLPHHLTDNLLTNNDPFGLEFGLLRKFVREVEGFEGGEGVFDKSGIHVLQEDVSVP